ncbi:ribonuclease H-like domain-containing protein [Tanacetum coccineum]
MEYYLWSMRMEQYLTFTDHALWEVIVNGDSVIPIASASAGAEGLIPPKTAEQKLARKNELKEKSTLMLAIPDEHLLKFHACKDAKSLWEAIKNRFGGNKESKKIKKTILKQNYANFAASSQEGLDKTYDSLPSAWNNIALIMRNKTDLDTLSMDDLYNNMKVYESDIKGKLSSSSNSQNVAFVSSDCSSSTNEIVNTAHSVSTASSKDQASTASYADNIDADDLEEIDLKWQVAMLTMRVKRKKVECYNCHRRGHFARECRATRNRGNRNRDDPRRNALVDTSTTNALAEERHHKLCSKWPNTSQYDQQREALNKSNLEIIGYQMGLESLEARIVVHEKNEAVYKKIIAFFKINVTSERHSIKDLKNQSADRKTTTSVPETETSISKTSKDVVEKPKTVRPSAPVATKSGQVPVNAAKQSSPRAATSISTARPVNTTAPKPKVNDALPTTYSYFKSHSPLVLLWEMGKMLLSPQHAGFGDQQEMLLTITPKTVDHTCLKDLTMLIYKADSSQ